MLAVQHMLQFLPVLIVQVERLGWARHTQVKVKTIPIGSVCYRFVRAVREPAIEADSIRRGGPNGFRAGFRFRVI
jgi:hypothetical protein